MDVLLDENVFKLELPRKKSRFPLLTPVSVPPVRLMTAPPKVWLAEEFTYKVPPLMLRVFKTFVPPP